MSRLPNIPDEIKNQTYSTLCEFGCARWHALARYAKALVISSDDIKEDLKEGKEALLGEKTLQILEHEKRITVSVYGDKKLVVPTDRGEMSLDTANIFEAYAALVLEVAEQEKYPEFCSARETTDYPFHYVFTGSKQDLLYKVLLHGHDSNIRLSYFNDTYNPADSGGFVTMLVVPDSYSWEAFSNIHIKGKMRIAFVQKTKNENSYDCILSEIFEE